MKRPTYGACVPRLAPLSKDYSRQQRVGDPPTPGGPAHLHLWHRQVSDPLIPNAGVQVARPGARIPASAAAAPAIVCSPPYELALLRTRLSCHAYYCIASHNIALSMTSRLRTFVQLILLPACCLGCRSTAPDSREHGCKHFRACTILISLSPQALVTSCHSLPQTCKRLQVPAGTHLLL